MDFPYLSSPRRKVGKLQGVFRSNKMDSAIQEEKQLIQRAKNDPEAFGQLYDRYFPHIFRYILSRTGNYELTQDLTAETFFQALKHLWRFRLLGRPFSAWLYKIAIAQIGNFYRQKSKYCEISLEEFPELFIQHSRHPQFKELESEEWKKFQEIHVLLGKIKPLQHDIIVLRYFNNKSLEEISSFLGLKVNTVKSHLRRGLATLRKIIISHDNLIFQKHHEERLQQYKKSLETNKTS